MHASRGKLFSKCLLNVKMKCLIIKRKFQTKYPTKDFFSLLLTFQNGNHNKSFDFFLNLNINPHYPIARMQKIIIIWEQFKQSIVKGRKISKNINQMFSEESCGFN